jgi:hypothetical protein
LTADGIDEVPTNEIVKVKRLLDLNIVDVLAPGIHIDVREDNSTNVHVGLIFNKISGRGGCRQQRGWMPQSIY